MKINSVIQNLKLDKVEVKIFNNDHDTFSRCAHFYVQAASIKLKAFAVLPNHRTPFAL